MSFIKDIGMAAANTATGGLLGMVFGGINDKRQIKQQQRMTDMQVKAQKDLTDFNSMKQMEMWKNTSYPAQLAMMKEAGLSPGLMYGGGGAGGSTANIAAGSVGGGTAAGNSGEMMGMVSMGLQQQTLEIQKQLAETQKRLADAEIPKKQAETRNLTTEGNILDIQEDFRNATLNADIHTVKYQTDIALQELGILRNNGIISNATWSTEIEVIQNEGAMIALKNSLLAKSGQLQDAQMEEIAQRIKASVKQLEQGDRALTQRDKEILIDKERNRLIETGIWVGGATQVIGNIVDIFKKRPAGGMGGKK